ncbi:MAG TPA: GUN4 domain-containing protein [Nodularia sp. (in: cyanobacteria)]|nr:GUN4 domain-containing protein [Nodularia sp. (in: cyanobacteria)]
MAKIALLIGVSEYGEGIPPLSSALNDVEAMQRVLEDPNLGGFEQVKPLLNPDTIAMRKAIQKLFKEASKEDLVLLFFSGHGITNDDNHLYLTTRETAKHDFEATAVDASFIQSQSNNCYAKRQILILDACYSGAYAQGWRAKSVGVDIKQQLGAEGRVVLTSSSATQTSFEQEGSTLSLYTQYLVEGIESGAADKDNSGTIFIHELHAYAKEKVKAIKPNMTPEIILDKEGFNIIIANAPRNSEAESLQSQRKQEISERSQQQLEQEKAERRREQEATQEPTTLTLETDDLSSDKGVDYKPLRDLLKAGQWEEADQETLKVIVKAAHREEESYLDTDSIKNFSCTDLRTIDQLWVKYSNKRLGFSVQKHIWKSVGGNPKADYETWCKFCDRVSWRKGIFIKEWLDYDDLFDSNAKGRLPALIYQNIQLHFFACLPDWSALLCQEGLSSIVSRLVKCKI